MTVASDSRPTESSSIPRPIGFGPVALPRRDMAQSKRFFTEVLGGELVEDGATPRIRFGTFELALGLQGGGTTAPHNEHPHYAFLVPAQDLRRPTNRPSS